MKAGFVLALMVAASVASGAHAEQDAAQPDTGTRLSGHAGSLTTLGDDDRTKVKFTPAQTEVSMQRTARCVVSRKPADVVSYLDEPSDAQPSAAFKAIQTQLPGCVGLAAYASGYTGTQLSMSSYTLRGMLAEAEISARRYPLLQSSPAVRQSYAANWMSKDTGQEVVDEMGACLADWRPAESMDLLKTFPGSTQEAQGLAAMSPLFGTCLRKGATLKTNALGIRAALALGLYHRIMSPTTSEPVRAAPAEPPHK